jgi:acyl-coenzyme A synthetase/AMP-(fatty) acid ligase
MNILQFLLTVESGLPQNVLREAVIGAPDEEMGEKVIAVVQPIRWEDAGPSSEEELRNFSRAALGGVKCPKHLHFRDTLPREPTGKLMKRLLREDYRKLE